jgi:hypothetical protein
MEHCSPYDVKNPGEPGFDSTIDGKYNSSMGLTLRGQTLNQSFTQFNAQVQEMKINLNNILPKINGSDISLTANYTDKNKEYDKNIRTAICDYYLQVATNKLLQEKLLNTSSFDSTAAQAIKDSTLNYRKKYLELFNIVSGIFMASGYIYIYAKTLPFLNKK